VVLKQALATSSTAKVKRKYENAHCPILQLNHNSASCSNVSDLEDDGLAPDIDWSNENLDEVVFTEVSLASGMVGKVVYRNGGVVDAAALENLCDRVCCGIVPLFLWSTLIFSFLHYCLTEVDCMMAFLLSLGWMAAATNAQGRSSLGEQFLSFHAHFRTLRGWG